MSDAFLTEFWAKARPPWNTLGPEFAERMAREADRSQLGRWRRQIIEARGGRSVREVADGSGVSDHEIWRLERGEGTKGCTGFQTLAAFYGITLV